MESFRALRDMGGPLHLVSNSCPFRRGKGIPTSSDPKDSDFFEFRRRDKGIFVARISGVDKTRNRSLGSDKFPFSYRNDLMFASLILVGI